MEAHFRPGDNGITPPRVSRLCLLGYEVAAQTVGGLAGAEEHCAQRRGLRAVLRKRVLIRENGSGAADRMMSEVVGTVEEAARNHQILQ